MGGCGGGVLFGGPHALQQPPRRTGPRGAKLLEGGERTGGGRRSGGGGDVCVVARCRQGGGGNEVSEGRKRIEIGRAHV